MVALVAGRHAAPRPQAVGQQVHHHCAGRPGQAEHQEKGPQQGLARTIPAETAVRALYLTPAGICYLDLTSGVAENHPGGIRSELLSIYSIVNSLVLNVAEIEAVKILINGDESMTLAGHIDLAIPIKANMLLIR